MFGYIYLTTNLVNGRKYIGKRISPVFDIKYNGSGTLLKKAINKYGKENFKTEIIESVNHVPTICESNEELNYSEWYYINYFNCVESEEYYNLKPGGIGGSNKDSIYITSLDGLQHKKVLPEELEEYLSNGWYKAGPRHTKEQIDKIKMANTGQKRSLESCKNISNSLIGKKYGPLTEEHKLKLRKVGQDNQPNMKKIICVETNEVFKSLGEAARHFNISTSNICRNLRHNGSSVKGYNFKYIN